MFRDSDLRLHVERSVVQDGFALHAIVHPSYRNGDKISIAEPLVFTQVGIEAVYGTSSTPIAFLSHQAAQELLDELWNAGVRPTDRRDVNPALAANESHISDLRSVVDRLFKLLDLP